jgi:hypothetical protein
METNLVAYCAFLSFILPVIVVVGNICYRNGNIFVEELLHGHRELCLTINRLLLAGYYLIVIGYVFTTLINWESVQSLTHLVEQVALKASGIIGILSILHYLNIIILTKYARKLIH